MFAFSKAAFQGFFIQTFFPKGGKTGENLGLSFYCGGKCSQIGGCPVIRTTARQEVNPLPSLVFRL